MLHFIRLVVAPFACICTFAYLPHCACLVNPTGPVFVYFDFICLIQNTFAHHFPSTYIEKLKQKSTMFFHQAFSIYSYVLGFSVAPFSCLDFVINICRLLGLNFFARLSFFLRSYNSVLRPWRVLKAPLSIH